MTQRRNKQDPVHQTGPDHSKNNRILSLYPITFCHPSFTSPLTPQLNPDPAPPSDLEFAPGKRSGSFNALLASQRYKLLSPRPPPEMLLKETTDPFKDDEFAKLACKPSHEVDMRNACSEVWPSSTVRGWYFHYTTATFKHIMDLGLCTKLRVQTFAINTTRWLLHSNSLQKMTSFPPGSQPSNPLFPIHSWNKHNASLLGLQGSTYVAEGWHHGCTWILF